MLKFHQEYFTDDLDYFGMISCVVDAKYESPVINHAGWGNKANVVFSLTAAPPLIAVAPSLLGTLKHVMNSF